MSFNRKTLIMLALMLVGLASVYIGLYISPLGFLATVGMWILIIIVGYDHYRTQKKYEQKYTQH